MGTVSPLRGGRKGFHEICLPPYHGDAGKHLRGIPAAGSGVPKLLGPPLQLGLVILCQVSCLSFQLDSPLLDEYLVSSSENRCVCNRFIPLQVLE